MNDLPPHARKESDEDRALRRGLLRYLVPMITGCNLETPIQSPLWPANLPDISLRKPMINAYFCYVSPIYPILDKTYTPERLESLTPDEFGRNPRLYLLLKMISCTGAACMEDRDVHGNDVKHLRESLFSQVLAEAFSILTNFDIINVQVVILIIIYCWQTERFSTAWQWCGWGIRILHYLEYTVSREKLIQNKGLLEFLTWSLFILESQILLLQFRDDPRLESERVKEPEEGVRGKHPVLFYRLSLARLAHKFSRVKGIERPKEPAEFDARLEMISEGIMALKVSIPLEWRPDHEIFADPVEHPGVVALHLEYHMLQMQIFTSKTAQVQILHQRPTRRLNVESEAGMAREEQKAYVTNARRVFQMLGGIMASSKLNTAMKWLSPSVHLIGAFQVLYSFVIRTPTYISASSDVQLLWSACAYFESNLAEVSQGSGILAAMQAMQSNAAKEIQRASGNSTTTTTVEDSEIYLLQGNAPMIMLPSYDGFDGLLLGLNVAYPQLTYGTDDMEMGLDLGVEGNSLQLNGGH